jgi:upstream activation factor subunit UAF30
MSHSASSARPVKTGPIVQMWKRGFTPYVIVPLKEFQLMATKKKVVAKKAVKKKVVAKKVVAKKAVKAVKAVKKVAKKAAKPAVKRKPNAAFMKPMTPSAILGAVIGAAPAPRTEVTKKIWAYIKKHGLQDAKNKRMINADDKLKELFGGKKQVSMFDMTKLVSNHLK